MIHAWSVVVEITRITLAVPVSITLYAEQGIKQSLMSPRFAMT